jgi:predicted ferric reductase
VVGADIGLPGLNLDFGEHTYWYLGRSTGLIAYCLLFIAVILGVSISSRFFDGLLGRAWFFELHKFVSIFLIAAVLVHAFVMLPDPYAGFTVDELLVPFRSHWKPTAMAIGILTLYLLVLITLSFYITRLIGQRAWRSLHYLTFIAYMGAAIHGLLAGTDLRLLEVRYLYLATAMGLVFFLMYRVLAERSARKGKVVPLREASNARRVSA